MNQFYLKGFDSVTQEYKSILLSAEVNNLPEWFSGKVLRVGPAKFNIGNQKLNHWFDGLAMVYKFEKIDNNIIFSNSFLKSPQYRANLKNKMLFDEFATTSPKNKLQKIFTSIKRILKISKERPSCNVNFMKAGKNLLAITEVTNTIKLDNDGISTLGEYSFNDDIKGQITCAHPQYDPDTKEQFNFAVSIGKDFEYSIFRMGNREEKRDIICKFKSKDFFYSHSLFLTKNYIILYAGPLRAKAASFLTKTFNESLYYKKDARCEFIFIDRSSGEISKIDSERMLFLHSVNAYEKDGFVNLDIVAYLDELNPYDNLYLDKIKKGSFMMRTELRRYEVDILNKNSGYKILSKQNLEFPRINPDFLTKEYRYVYAAMQNQETPEEFFNGIVKVDLENNQEDICLLGEGEYVSEPIFIKEPGATNEDDGLIFINVLDAKKDLSYISILNAKDLTLLYKAYLPIKIPFSLHGIYLK